ncbi:MAG: 3-oxoacyl-ACP synthase III [Deltaproteobacteria bacterium]|nr:3-oxoacyl-ACP synthase III [Deltaproteobacteria bacterium]
MRYEHVCLESWAYELPKTVVPSSEIEASLAPLVQKFELPSGFFEILTGIREKRLWDESVRPSTISTQTAQKALTSADLAAKDIQFLVHCSVSRDFLEPATALVVHRNLGLAESTHCFDISNACLGFLNGLMVIADMIETGHIQRGMVVATETPKKLINAIFEKLKLQSTLTLQDAQVYFPTLTLGSGSCAFILAHRSVSKTGHRILGGIAQTASEYHGVCQAGPDMGIVDSESSISMQTQAQKLIEGAKTLATHTWPLFLQELHWQVPDIHHIFSHQVGRTPRTELIQALKVSETLDFPTYDTLGNMASVSLPISFAMGIQKRNVKPKDHIVFFGFGSGIHCLCLGIQW